MIDPATVYLSHDTRFGRDVTSDPTSCSAAASPSATTSRSAPSAISKAPTIGDGAHRRAVRAAASRARSSGATCMSAISSRSRRRCSRRAPRPTTSPISAMRMSAAGANIGAGTITCNYDGFFKHRTEIGAGAFIGSNTALVAPVKVGDGAIVGAGSVDHRATSRPTALVLSSGPRAKSAMARSVRERRWRSRKAAETEQELSEQCAASSASSARHEVAPLLIEGLRRLEYRGYDSAGIATLVNGTIERRRAEGKLVNLEKLLQERAGGRPDRHRPHALGDPWRAEREQRASARRPTASPSCTTASSRISASCGASSTAKGTASRRDTDTEVVVHLITDYLHAGVTPQEATAKTLARLEGAFALGILFAGRTDLMIAARARLAARDRLRRRRDVPRLRRAGAGAADAVDLLPRGRRLGGDHADRRARSTMRRARR